ncbi:hypothetical protein [Rouxiella chamberiensis]|uniref:Uncharacterized protein n=1 Tax=Rouxiella chamberiensis TaxID=1513468 RepID=A0ABY7HL95_9GAMM|nr:hypothetical protein [Rouxiella chamberiensis]WAS99843.1 hypothetical protein O1V66_12160 [Rouxiella chamberiensis]
MKIESNTHAKATPAQQEAYRQLNSELLSKFERINNVTSSNQSMNSNSPAATPPTLERPVLNNGETAPVVNKNKTTTHFPLKKAILKKAKELATSKQVQNLPFFKQISSIKQIFQPKVVATTPKRHPGYIKTNILRPAAKLPEGETPAAVPLEETTVLPTLSRRPSSASLVPLPSHTDSGFLTDNSPDPSLPTPTTISPDPDAVSLTSLSSSRTPISAEDSATFTFGLHGDEPPRNLRPTTQTTTLLLPRCRSMPSARLQTKIRKTPLRRPLKIPMPCLAPTIFRMKISMMKLRSQRAIRFTLPAKNWRHIAPTRLSFMMS